MIKVKHTEQYQGNIVCKGKLVLIQINLGQYMAIKPNGIIINNLMFKPIIISEIESIETGDKYFDKKYKIINNCVDDADKEDLNFRIKKEKSVNKILALPEHFSPEQLQMIVDGKLKDGDEVMVECIKPSGAFDGLECQIKLNQQNHINIIEKRKQFVVLEGIEKGNRFFTTNSDNNCYSKDGELWYKEIAFCDTTEEAQQILYGNKEESWDDNWNEWCKVGNGKREDFLQNYIDWLKENYHPPKRK